ncbi:MAG: N-acetyltransferase [Bacteroidales bacterium]|nr:N-acetyltransferase [Bacteroidales bacterium]
MKIRLASREDLPVINDIYNQAVQQRFCTAHLSPVSLEQHGEWYAEHDPNRFPVFVAGPDDHVYGWVSLSSYRSGRQALAHVGEVSYYVDEKERGKGVGTMLLEHAISVAPGFGMSVLIAILLDKNPASIALLQKFGFSRWGAMPGIARIDNETADHLYYGLKL